MRLIGWLVSTLVLAGTPCLAVEPDENPDPRGNKVLSVTVNPEASPLAVEIRTEKPVGARYTAYDARDPLRLVLDFPGMDVSAVTAPEIDNRRPLREIQVSSAEMPSGSLGRIEMLLTENAEYQVLAGEEGITVSFAESRSADSGREQEDIQETAAERKAESPPPEKTTQTVPAGAIQAVRFDRDKAVLTTDGAIARFKSFSLGNPPRLVVDVLGVQPGFAARQFPMEGDFRQLRVGRYEDKTRLVFDAAGQTLPEHDIAAAGSDLIVSWKPERRAASPVTASQGGTVTVEAIDFGVVDDRSILTITLSGRAEVIEPTSEGTSVRFGIRDAKISRALRRTIDSSAFPSAVRRVIPYIVAENGKDNVRFAAELKGLVPYVLKNEGSRLRFIVDNGRFAEEVQPTTKELQLAVPAAEVTPAVIRTAALKEEKAAKTAVPEKTAPVTKSLQDAPKYGGEKISLVFDDANIRNILQLIGEVSDLNIIAGEEIKGTITLRLIDVPWDQALDLILETKELGTLREGNVVRIMPKEKLRAQRQAELSAVREERQLESLSTDIIPVSYSDLKSITAPAKELLTDRGKITEDDRNKQIIVTDIPVVIAEIRRLTAILDTPERQVMLEARIVEASSTFTRDLGVKWGISYEVVNSGSGDISRSNTGLGGSFLLAPPAPGSVAGGAGLASGITFGRLGIDSTVLDLRISALESSGHGKVISTPRVTTLNGGEATISQGTKIPYQSSGNDGLPKTEFIDANLELKVKPVINPDNSIILDIEATNSSIGSTVSTGSGSAPAIDTKEAKTKVIVRNGETTVIGGIFVETDNSSQAGVPWLMRMPLLGRLFRSDNNSTTRSELLVFITPRIVE